MKLAEYCKFWEQNNSQYLIPDLPVYVRVDGRAFHSYTRNMRKPFDTCLVSCMRETAKALLREWDADLAYVQSDEISLFFVNEKEYFPFFKGKKDKIVSLLASSTTAHFARNVNLYDSSTNFPQFDARVWQAPTEYLYKYFIWRQDDAIRNSISMLAHAYFSHKSLHGVSTKEALRRLAEKGINWHHFPYHLKMGSFFAKRDVVRKYTPKEIFMLPEKHEARLNRDLQVRRRDVVELELPRLRSVTNFLEIVYFEEEVEQQNVERR